MGHVARSCLVADRLAAAAGVPAARRQELYFVTLLGWVGCIADSREAATWFGDDIEYRAGVYDLDMRPFFTGHSRAVADLAAATARRLGLGPDDVRLVRRAGLVHGLGRIGVPNTIWDKAALTTVESERLRLYPYYTERMLARSPVLAAVDAVAGSAHERLDGSGYHRGRSGAQLPTTARVLAVAESYRTSLEERPHRPPATPGQAAARLERESAQGDSTPAAVDAVLAVVGSRPAQARPPEP